VHDAGHHEADGLCGLGSALAYGFSALVGAMECFSSAYEA
jgi:hypothetical protein